jgi:hypothetical protein
MKEIERRRSSSLYMREVEIKKKTKKKRNKKKKVSNRIEEK